ncbi:MAG TPA: hypothetical protein VF193_10925, partial [Steroidobacter sp.]
NRLEPVAAIDHCRGKGSADPGQSIVKTTPHRSNDPEPPEAPFGRDSRVGMLRIEVRPFPCG